jgi:hypothetical protein
LWWIKKVIILENRTTTVLFFVEKEYRNQIKAELERIGRKDLVDKLYQPKNRIIHSSKNKR